MFFRILGTMAILGMMVTSVDAQTSVAGGVSVDGYHSSTAAEGYLRGRGAAAIGAGQYLESLGRYQNLNQEARRRAYDNWVNGVRTRWDIKDEYKARFRRDHPTYPERRMHQLDMIEARALVEKREEEMRAKGLLHPKPESAFGYNGVRYKSYAEFKTTPAYKQMIADRDAKAKKREAEKVAEKARYDAATKFLAERSRMDPITRMMMDERNARHRRLKKIMGEEWWNEHMSNPNDR